MIAVTDGLRHQEVRKLILQSFWPQQLERVTERVQGRTGKLLADAVEKHTVECAEDIADRILINTVGDLRGRCEAWCRILRFLRDKRAGRGAIGRLRPRLGEQAWFGLGQDPAVGQPLAPTALDEPSSYFCPLCQRAPRVSS